MVDLEMPYSQNQQVVASEIGRLDLPMPTTLTAVVVNKDKRSSTQAVKWTIKHLLIGGDHTVILLHVRSKNPAAPMNQLGSSASAETASGANREDAEIELQRLFASFKILCARRTINTMEVVLEDHDIPKAMVDYITTNHIHNFVIGAYSRCSITKKFRFPDNISTSFTKSAPEFCSVYVIFKGKAIAVRSAKGPPPTSSAVVPRLSSVSASAHSLSAGPDESIRSGKGNFRVPAAAPGLLTSSASLPEKRYRLRSTSVEHSFPKDSKMPNGDVVVGREPNSLSSHRALRLSVSSEDSISSILDFRGSLDLKTLGFCHALKLPSNLSEGPRGNHSPSPSLSQKDLKDEMRRLKLELKQIMYMYSSVCKEAILAKHKAQELLRWKMEKSCKVEEARQAKEVALKMAEMEKARCLAALEVVEKAKRITKIEVQKRFNAEMKAKQESDEKIKLLDALAMNDVRYRKYSIDEIEFATENFCESLKIGEGGYGPVYGACLNHTLVAIKVLSPDAAQGRKQFQQEIEVLSCIRHPNMVLLLGACPEFGCLVYEYMVNGSLEDRLFRRGNTPTIPWSTRFKIAAEIATALLFLHQATPEPLVHRDLKPANILLDRNYVSKISDVGLSRLVPASVANQVTQYRMTSTAGTFCYIDPEYQQTGMLGTKSDIYSLGILLLQIITAKPPMGLTHHVQRAIDKGTFTEMLDNLVKDWPVEEALSFAKLALKCAELKRKDRPDLATVILPELNRLRNLAYAYEDSISCFPLSLIG